MNAIEALCKEYERVLRFKWPSGLSGEERVWMAIYEPSNERRLRARLAHFELSTKEAGRRWQLVNIDQMFPEWMASNRYREELFANPRALPPALEAFQRDLAARVKAELDKADDKTVVALLGSGSLFGLWSVSELVSLVADNLKGILLVFFPGRHEGNSYRLMDAKASWNYRALAIEAKVGESA